MKSFHHIFDALSTRYFVIFLARGGKDSKVSAREKGLG